MDDLKRLEKPGIEREYRSPTMLGLFVNGLAEVMNIAVG